MDIKSTLCLLVHQHCNCNWFTQEFKYNWQTEITGTGSRSKVFLVKLFNVFCTQSFIAKLTVKFNLSVIVYVYTACLQAKTGRV